MKPKTLLAAAIGRGHAIAKKLSETTELHSIMPFPNPGIISCSKTFQLGNIVDPQVIVAFAKKIKPEYVFIAPDDPIAAGAADACIEAGFPAVAPLKSLARLESDKAFARDFLAEYAPLANPRFKKFHDAEEAKEHIDSIGYDFVIKPMGLTGGKGVKVLGSQLKNREEAKAYAAEAIAADRVGGIVIEEKLVGEEFSFQFFVDGSCAVPMPLAQDHKPAFENDLGPMTGGMGSYTCENHSLPFVTTEEYQRALEVVDKTVKGIKAKTGKQYKGILYAQFMVTASGPKIIEFNARLGDPEAMNVLPLLKTDLHEVCKAIIDGTLSETKIDFANQASVCKYIVPAGYPDRKDKFKFSIDETVLGETQLFYSGVEQKEDGLYTTGSRGLGLTSLGSTLQDAYDEVETAISRIDMKGFRYRKDIASADSIRKKMERMKKLRGF